MWLRYICLFFNKKTVGIGYKMEMITQTSTERKQVTLSKREKSELFTIIGAMVASVLIIPQLKALFAILPIIYFLIERRVRNRTSEETGLLFSNIPRDLAKNWYYILLVGVGMQFFYLFMYNSYFPQVLKHVLSRIPINIQDLNPQLFLSIIVLALGEEIVFRGLIQARLNRLVPTWIAIGLTSILFAVMHISTGSTMVVILDLLSVFLDSVLFGIIFARTQNIYTSTIAHVLANSVAILSMYIFI